MRIDNVEVQAGSTDERVVIVRLVGLPASAEDGAAIVAAINAQAALANDQAQAEAVSRLKALDSDRRAAAIAELTEERVRR